jgi:signal transduction histidine kinase
MAPYLEELQRYVDFGADDAGRLRRLHDRIVGGLPVVIAHFYEVLVAHEGARAAITEGAPQIARLKHTLLEWLTSSLRGPHDEVYYERRSRIGRRHVAIGLPQQYMFSAMNVMRRDLHRLIEAHVDDERAATRDSVDKLLDIELAIMLRHYQLEAEERLVRRERGAQMEKLTAMQSLSAGLAHEVRNPLNAAKLQLELLQRRLRKGDHDPRLVDATVLIHDDIGRLSVLLDEFLAFARPANLALGTTDLVALVRHVIELERPAADLRQVALSVVGSAPSVVAEVDAAKVHQVVQNLLRNAIEASPVGGEVEITIEAVTGAAAIRVRDHGPGIPPDVLPRIYEPFYSTKEGGTGMGMAIVHSLVTLHGGAIEARVDGGTELSVYLPRR